MARLQGYTPRGFIRRWGTSPEQAKEMRAATDQAQQSANGKATMSQVTAAVAAGLVGYATTHSVNVAVASALAVYTTTEGIGQMLQDYLKSSDLPPELEPYALVEQLPPPIWVAEGATDNNGEVDFETPAGMFSEAPVFIFTPQAPGAAPQVYTVQQQGNVTQSGAPGERVYSVTAKVFRSVGVTVLGLDVVNMQEAPANTGVTAQARVAG